MTDTVMPRRQIFKVQMALNIDDDVLIYSKHRAHIEHLEGMQARKIINHYDLHKGKPKTYVYGQFDPEEYTIHLESFGELPRNEWPWW